MRTETFHKNDKLKYFRCEDPKVKNEGYYEMTNNDYFPHLTLKDTAMHPKGWDDFSLKLGYSRFDAEAELTLCFGKPYANDAINTAAVKLVLTTKSICVTSPKGKANIEVQFDEKGCIQIWSSGNKLMLNEYEIPGVQLTDLYGYMEFYCEHGWFYFSDFAIESAKAPYTQEEHDQVVLNWRQAVLTENDKNIDTLEVYLKEHPEALLQKKGDLIVSHRLVDRGEKITVDVICYGSFNAALLITENCYGHDAEPVPYVLELKKDGENYRQRITLQCNVPGNLKLELWANEQRIVRQVAVLDKGYMALIPWSGENIPPVTDELHKYDIPADCWLCRGMPVRNPEDSLKKYQKYVKNSHEYGDRVVPFVNSNEIFPGSEVGNLFELDRESQERGLKQFARLMQVLGYDSMELLASYTTDEFAIQILEKLGVKGLTSLCIWQNCQDGAGLINHCGGTCQPYYPAADDFRHVGEQRKIMCFTMGNSTCSRNYSIMAYEGVPTNVVPGERYFDHRVLHYSVQRWIDAFDGYLADLKNNDGLMTITLGLESFRGYMDHTAVNSMAIRYVVKKAATEKIVFVSAADVSEYHQRKNMPMQEAYFIQPDVYYGFHNGELPGNIGDRIEAETRDYLAVVRRGYTLPMYFFDYTKIWENKPFDDTKCSEFGVVNPDTHTPSESLPEQVYREDMIIDTQMTEGKVVITVDSETPKEKMVTGVFDIPYEADFTISADKEDVKMKKISDCWTGNTHLFVDLGSLDSGKTEITITLDGTPRVPDKTEYRKDEFEVKWFKDHAYMRCTDREQAIRVKMHAPEGAYIMWIDGSILRPENGTWEFVLNETWINEGPILRGCSKEAFAEKMQTAQVEIIGPTKCNRWSW